MFNCKGSTIITHAHPAVGVGFISSYRNGETDVRMVNGVAIFVQHNASYRSRDGLRVLGHQKLGCQQQQEQNGNGETHSSPRVSGHYTPVPVSAANPEGRHQRYQFSRISRPELDRKAPKASLNQSKAIDPSTPMATIANRRKAPSELAKMILPATPFRSTVSCTRPRNEICGFSFWIIGESPSHVSLTNGFSRFGVGLPDLLPAHPLARPAGNPGALGNDGPRKTLRA